VITNVEINQEIQKQLDKDIKNGLFKSEVRELIAFWIIEIGEVGFEEYIKSNFAKALCDHELKDSRQGERSIHLNETGGRLIYKCVKSKIIIKVIKITTDHDYK